VCGGVWWFKKWISDQDNIGVVDLGHEGGVWIGSG